MSSVCWTCPDGRDVYKRQASHCVNKIITEMCVLEVTDKGLLMTEINPEFTVEQVQAATAAPITVSENLKSMVD